MSPRHVPATQAELSRIGLLAELPGEQLFELAKRMRREEIAGGQAPIIEGEEGDRFYVVLQGVFAVSNVGALPKRMLRPGDYFGEIALAMNIPRTANVRALTPATVASCDKATFDELLRPLFADDEEGD
jgi:ATP-binding cassette, subfamily B, bacterial